MPALQTCLPYLVTIFVWKTDWRLGWWCKTYSNSSIRDSKRKGVLLCFSKGDKLFKQKIRLRLQTKKRFIETNWHMPGPPWTSLMVTTWLAIVQKVYTSGCLQRLQTNWRLALQEYPQFTSTSVIATNKNALFNFSNEWAITSWQLKQWILQLHCSWAPVSETYTIQ